MQAQNRAQDAMLTQEPQRSVVAYLNLSILALCISDISNLQAAQ